MEKFWEVEKHGAKYSKAFNFDGSPWKSDFDSMAMKTCLRMLLSKYGYMSIDMAQVFSDEEDETNAQAAIDEGMAEARVVDTATGEIVESTARIIDQGSVMPGSTAPAPKKAPFVQ